MDQLVGAAEIAERLGSNRTTYVHDLRRRHPDFPTPVATLKSGYVWAWPDVEKWARATGRLKGSGGLMPADSNFNRDATSFLGVLIRVVAGFVLIGGVVYGFAVGTQELARVLEVFVLGTHRRDCWCVRRIPSSLRNWFCVRSALFDLRPPNQIDRPLRIRAN